MGTSVDATQSYHLDTEDTLLHKGKDPDPDSAETCTGLSASLHSSAVAFVKGGLQDACDDSCSICLEPFSDRDPATVTSCKHEYHLQCILEWAQRSKECPMCWQFLQFLDPMSQELLDAVEQERSLWARNSVDGMHFQIPSFSNYADFEERIMQHLAHQLARRGSLENRFSRMQRDELIRSLNEQGIDQHSHRKSGIRISDGTSSSHFGSRSRLQQMQRHDDNLEENNQRSSDVSSLSGSLKSRFLVASSKCKETLFRTTRSFRERWQGRNNSTIGFKDQVEEVSVDVVREALKRISPEGVENEHDDASTTSDKSPVNNAMNESSNKSGACSGCVTSSHLEGRAVSVQPPSETV